MQNRFRGESPLNVVRVFQPEAVDTDDLLGALELLLTSGVEAFEPIIPPRDEPDPRLAFNPQLSESCVTDRGPHNAHCR
jgi:hypothetical protein